MIDLELFHVGNTMCGTVANKLSHVSLKPVWAAPHSHGERFLALLNSKGDEVLLIESPRDNLSPESLAVLDSEFRRRDLTAQIVRITAARQEYGATYWTVQTDRGEREFVTQNLAENAQWYGENHLVLLDVDGNRFQCDNVEGLDAASRAYLDSIL